VAQAAVKSPACNDKIGADTGSGETAASHRTTDRTCDSGQNLDGTAGTTLREMLMKWAQDTRCESGASPHWTVIWPVAVTDYRLDAPLTFRGSFETMLGQMFDLYRTAQKRFMQKLPACSAWYQSEHSGRSMMGWVILAISMIFSLSPVI
jgi:hypothetical protein